MEICDYFHVAMFVSVHVKFRFKMAIVPSFFPKLLKSYFVCVLACNFEG